MRTLKSIYGIAGALAPIGYCGYLVYYFLDVSGSVQEAQDIGLGPTVLGLSVVGLLFCIPLIFKILRLVRGARPPRSGGNTPPDKFHGNPQGDDDDDSGAAADAAIARYLARKAAEVEPSAPLARPAQQGATAAARSFGRKSGQHSV